MSSGILTVNSISYTYHPERPEAINKVSFEILSDTVTAIIGPNGAGKTTLLHLMLGLLKPITGSVLVEDVPISEYSSVSSVNGSGWYRNPNTFHLNIPCLNTSCWAERPILGHWTCQAEKMCESRSNHLKKSALNTSNRASPGVERR
jgi:energy-coupling factor transporter ATP-binding protein EcfA2